MTKYRIYFPSYGTHAEFSSLEAAKAAVDPKFHHEIVPSAVAPTWTMYQEMHAEKVQDRMRAILRAEGLSDSYTWLDLQVLADVLACGPDAFNISVAKHALRSLHVAEVL